MSRNPFDKESRLGERKTSQWLMLFWKGYFAFAIYVAVVTWVYLPGVAVNVFDMLDFGVALVALVGLYGYIFSTRLFNVVFWRYFFYAALIESIIFCLFLPLFGVERYGRSFNLDPYYLVELLYLLPMLYALNHYAYKRPALWRRRN